MDDPYLLYSLQFATPDQPFIVESEAKRRQAENILESQGRTDIEVVLQKREDYDGEEFIIDVE